MTKKFEVGKSYSVRSICDWDCVYRFTVTKRTAQTVWLDTGDYRGVKARRVRIVDGMEACDPHGRYSMSPVLMAKDDHAAG